MVSSAGISLMNSYGSGVRHYQHMHQGHGIARRAISGLVGLAGRALLNKLTGAIAGTGTRRRTYRRRATAGSYKPTGTGMHHRRTYRKRIGTTRTHAIGGYRRKVHRVGCGEGYRKINHIGYGEGYRKKVRRPHVRRHVGVGIGDGRRRKTFRIGTTRRQHLILI